MDVKQFHIITVGVSLITNYQRKINDERVKNVRLSDTIWRELLEQGAFINELLDFLKENPRDHSAEVNSFEGYCEKENINPRNCLVYLAGTKTEVNELAVNVLTRYFNEKGVSLLTPKEVSGYMWEKEIAPDTAVEEFQRGVAELLDTFLIIASKKKEEGYEVLFNPTGGMKPHVIACALAGFMTASKVYYIHEEFEKRDIVVLPHLLYLPRGAEVRVMKMIKEKGQISGGDFESLANSYSQEIERLEFYDLIIVERDEITEKKYRAKLSNKGKYIMKIIGGL